MSGEKRLYEQGLEAYPASGILIGNLAMLLWIALGAVSMWVFRPLFAWAYLAVALAMVFVVLRGLLCTSCCYHGKWCHMGWGKLSALMFGKKGGIIEDFGSCVGMKLAPLTYGFLALVPLAFLSVSAIREFTLFKAAIFLLLLAVAFYSGAVERKKACAKCRMKPVCPGSAARQ